MPTGYTACIEDGSITTGKEFLMLCLRAFGVAEEIQDEPLSVPVPMRFEPDEWYKDHYADAAKRLEENKSIAFEDARLRMRDEHNKQIASAKRAIARMTEANERYKRVREQVAAWVPPTEKHNGIKKFALEQIDMSINTEDMFAYYQKIIDTPFDDSNKAVLKYIEESASFLKDEVESAQKRYEKSVASANEKTQFMEEFMKSLDTL